MNLRLDSRLTAPGRPVEWTCTHTLDRQSTAIWKHTVRPQIDKPRTVRSDWTGRSAGAHRTITWVYVPCLARRLNLKCILVNYYHGRISLKVNLEQHQHLVLSYHWRVLWLLANIILGITYVSMPGIDSLPGSGDTINQWN